jgi:hypothetical protein
VPAAVAVQVTTNNTGQWLTTTAKTSWGAVVTFSSGSTEAGQRSGPSSGNAAVDAGQQFFNDPVGVKSLQQYRASKILPLPQAPKAPASFRAQAWSAMQPLFGLLNTWAPQEVGAQKSQVQALLQIRLPQAGGGEAKSGDPLVNFVDRALYNNGNPLAVGSAPLYGTYWDGMGHSAFEALDMAMPYVQAGIRLVTTWWGVGAAAGLGAWCIVKEAFEFAGFATAANVLGGAPPDMLAENVASAFQRGALAAIPGLGNLLDLVDSARSFAEGDVLGGVLSGMSAFRMRGACFSGEMLLDVEGGKKRAEAIRVGDRLAARPELEPEGALAYKEVKEVFERWASIWEVEVGGQVLRTTGEHPFWVEGRRGWVSARELAVGDLLRTREGRLVAVSRVEATGSWERVYNWEVEDWHTYYVSADLDADGIWAHNAGGCGGGGRRRKRDVLLANRDARKAMDYEDALLDPQDREFYAKTPGRQERYNRDVHYPNTPTAADRRALGAGPGQVVDHDPPLVRRWYDGDPAIGELPGRFMTPEQRAASAADRSRMRVMSKTESDRQGRLMRLWSELRARVLGL